jgi:hypothetical protein
MATVKRLNLLEGRCPLPPFQRAHAAFEFGQVSRARKILVIASLFGVLQPMVNPREKTIKHRNLYEMGCKRCSQLDSSIGRACTAVGNPIVGGRYACVYLSFFT